MKYIFYFIILYWSYKALKTYYRKLTGKPTEKVTARMSRSKAQIEDAQWEEIR